MTTSMLLYAHHRHICKLLTVTYLSIICLIAAQCTLAPLSISKKVQGNHRADYKQSNQKNDQEVASTTVLHAELSPPLCCTHPSPDCTTPHLCCHTEEEEQGMDSFIDHDMEDDMAGDETAPGSATKRRKGPQGRAVYGMSRGANPQAAIQPGATPSGATVVQSRITRQMPAYIFHQRCLHSATLLICLRLRLSATHFNTYTS